MWTCPCVCVGECAQAQCPVAAQTRGWEAWKWKGTKNTTKTHPKSSGAWIPFPLPCFKGLLSVCDVGTSQQLFGIESQLVIFNSFTRFYLACKSQNGFLCLSLGVSRIQSWAPRGDAINPTHEERLISHLQLQHRCLSRCTNLSLDTFHVLQMPFCPLSTCTGTCPSIQKWEERLLGLKFFCSLSMGFFSLCTAHILGFDKWVSPDTVVSQPLLIFIMQNPLGNGLSQGNGKPLKDKKVLNFFLI